MGLASHIRLKRIDVGNAPLTILRHRLPQLQIVKCKGTKPTTQRGKKPSAISYAVIIRTMRLESFSFRHGGFPLLLLIRVHHSRDPAQRFSLP
jgi:hypothetical protein